MKKFIAFALVALMAMAGTNAAYAQENNGNKSAQKAQRDAERARQKAEAAYLDSLMHQSAVAAIEGRQFVLEADKVVFKRGETAYVNANTNFVLMNDDRGTVQVAFNTAFGGPNGIGGVTVDGNVSNVKMKTTKRGDVNASFAVQGIGISAQVFVTLNRGSNEATVTITPNFNSNTLTLHGKVVPLEQSSIFKGRAL